MVANLPYNVGTPLLLRLLRQAPAITRFVVMLQREAVERLAAPPGSRVYGLPSVVVRLHGTRRGRLPGAGHGVPAAAEGGVGGGGDPAHPAPTPGRAGHLALAAAAFGQRRKMLRRSLAAALADPAAVAGRRRHRPHPARRGAGPGGLPSPGGGGRCEAEAFAKVNLSLRVRARDASGRHPLHSLAQSIDWADRLALEEAEADSFVVTGLPAPADESNLAWRALEAVRAAATRRGPVALALEKHIPLAAGLGGGSADAAAALVLACGPLRPARRPSDRPSPRAWAPTCPSASLGGTAWMEGHGERLTASAAAGRLLAGGGGASLRGLHRGRLRPLGRPGRARGPGGAGAGTCPPQLRPYEPLVNDLVPAARSLVAGPGGLGGRPAAGAGAGRC